MIVGGYGIKLPDLAPFSGVTGGVIEAALRTAYEWMTGEELEKMEFEDLRGLKGTKKAQIDIGGEKVRIGVVNGLGNARRLLEKIRSGEEQFHAVEIMACPGGCIAGGGQPAVDRKSVV